MPHIIVHVVDGSWRVAIEIADGGATTWRELLQKIEKETGIPAGVQLITPPAKSPFDSPTELTDGEELKVTWIPSIMMEAHPLHYAARHENITALTNWIIAGVEPNMVSTEREETPLMWAAYGAALKAVATLLELGADVDRTDLNGRNALHHLLHYRHFIHGHQHVMPAYRSSEVARLLVANGLDPKVPDKDGKTSFDYLENLRSHPELREACEAIRAAIASASIEPPADESRTIPTTPRGAPR